MLLGHQQLRPRAAPIEYGLHRRDGESRRVVRFREMTKDDPGQTIRKQSLDSGGRILVAEVPPLRRDSLLQAPRVWSRAQHVEIVIRLERQNVEILEVPPRLRRSAAQIRRQPEAITPAALDHDSYRFPRIV